MFLNDLIITVDLGTPAFLLLLDLSATFHTVDHSIVLSGNIRLYYIIRECSAVVKVLADEWELLSPNIYLFLSYSTRNSTSGV